MTAEVVGAPDGLSLEEAGVRPRREYDEPFVVEARRGRLRQAAAARRRLRVSRGGRLTT